jgi:DNA-binding CsgD family transcriptional regulator
MDGLSARDLRLLRDALDPSLDSADDELIAQPVLDEIARLTRCDLLSLLVTNLPQRREAVQDAGLCDDDEVDPDDDGVFWDYYWGSGCSHPERTGDSSILWSGYSPPPLSEAADRKMRDLIDGWGWAHEMVVPLTSYDADDHRLLLRRASAPNFAEQDVVVLSLLRAAVSERHTRHLRRRSGVTLTPRQVEILRLVAAGSTNRQIAKALAISEGTARTHLANIYTKLGATNRTQALAVAGLQV